MIIDVSAAILLVGAGPVDQTILSKIATITHVLVAADGGAQTVLQAGLMPAAVIGDGDSLDATSRNVIPPARFHDIADQNSTDLEKSLANIRAPLIIGLGFLGGRFDHALAAMNALVKFRDQPVLLIGEWDACFHIAHDLQVDLAADTRFSVFPMAEARATSTGLAWPLDAHVFSPSGFIGTSNRTTGPVAIQTKDHGLIGIIPQSDWRAAARALWPAFPDR
ncbi:MAG: thiamine diphosphokinase [Deltaproteobacteria bacterium]